MRTLIVTLLLLTVSQAEADVTTTCTTWKEPPVIKEYNGKSWAVGMAMCKVFDNRPIPGNQTHGLQPTEIFCRYSRRDDVQACNNDGEYTTFDSKQNKADNAATRDAFKLYQAEKKKQDETAKSTASVDATTGR